MRYKDVCCLMPNYNNEKYIKQAIESVYDFCDVLVIDDGSTDNSPQIAKDLKVNVIEKENGGPASARNLGIAEILKGNYKYTILLDSDDWLRPNFLEQTYAEIQKDECVAVYGDYDIYLNDEDIYIREFKMSLTDNKLWQECLMPHQALIKNSVWQSIFDKFGEVYDNGLRVCNDYDVDLKINSFGYVKHIPESLGFVREGSNNQCGNILGKVRQDCMNKLKQNNREYYWD